MPKFTLTTADIARLHEVEAMCLRYRTDPSASIDLELEMIHRQFRYDRRPIIGVANSVGVHATGDIAFDKAWAANREANMRDAYREWGRVKLAELRIERHERRQAA
ncbi:hypothetical protein HNO88_000278 [Novosphingobium chloroacetimidivorans]|uniref:Uncharacterized protein n=1 Tax=Novosphingobium chloroacetimidivorans TaxID=1428314 RepID=A0A7W7K6V8_9SPHN|nr:hypothetical protein [Novosphingobium chloroacetimidivorans]MBB4856981.1 hypothetical protein [Novosphingobium chloroacetimidivorans]